MSTSTGYEPTTNNTLLAAVTNVVGDMDVDLPYGGGTGSSGGLATMAPTTPPHTTPIQSIMPAAVVHHGAPLAAPPFYGGSGTTAIGERLMGSL